MKWILDVDSVEQKARNKDGVAEKMFKFTLKGGNEDVVVKMTLTFKDPEFAVDDVRIMDVAKSIGIPYRVTLERMQRTLTEFKASEEVTEEEQVPDIDEDIVDEEELDEMIEEAEEAIAQ